MTCMSHVHHVGVDITAEDSYKHVLQALDGRKVRPGSDAVCVACERHMTLRQGMSCAACMAGQIGILLVVAGHQQLDSLADVDAPGLRKHFEVNAIAPLLAVQALRGSLGMSSKVRAGNLHSPVMTAAVWARC